MKRKEATQGEGEFKKTVQNYTISYCNKEFLGRSLYGEVRLGFENNEKRVKAFRINPLPLSEQSRANLDLQKYYSQLGACVRLVYGSVESQSNSYTVMEYFPKTFKTELGYFRKLTKNMEPYIDKFLQAYSRLYYYRIAHGNISLDNIGIAFDGKVKLMDFRHLDQISF
jgi:serine/threonine protein kinase